MLPWLEEVKWHQMVSRQLAQASSVKPSVPSITTQAPAKYSLFPAPYSLPMSPAPQPRYISSTSFTPSDMSRSSSPGWSNEFPQPGNKHLCYLNPFSSTTTNTSLQVQPRDLDPDSPYGYPRPPPFRKPPDPNTHLPRSNTNTSYEKAVYNWDTPSISSARHARDSAIAHRAGYTGPPIGSRRRLPDPAPISLGAPPPTPTARTSSPPSPRTTTTGQFTYYPMMSPYEAEAAMGEFFFTDSHLHSQASLRIVSCCDCVDKDMLSCRTTGAYEKQVNKKVNGHPQTRAQMFPLLPREALFSTEQAAAAVAAAEKRGRDTIFIERGVDHGDFGGMLGRRRSSSYYGDDEGGGDEEVEEGGASL